MMMDLLGRCDLFQSQREMTEPYQTEMEFAVLEMVGDFLSRQPDSDSAGEISVSDSGLLMKKTGCRSHQAHVPQMN